MRTNATVRVTTRTQTGTDYATKIAQFSESHADYRVNRQDLPYSEILRRTGDKSIRRMADAFVPRATNVEGIQAGQPVTDTATGETGTVYAIDILENSLLIRWDDVHPSP